MADILIRNVDDATKRRLAAQAKRNGRSQSAEALSVLEQGLRAGSHGWVDILRDAAICSEGFDLHLPARRPGRPIDTSDWA